MNIVRSYVYPHYRGYENNYARNFLRRQPTAYKKVLRKEADRFVSPGLGDPSILEIKHTPHNQIFFAKPKWPEKSPLFYLCPFCKGRIFPMIKTCPFCGKNIANFLSNVWQDETENSVQPVIDMLNYIMPSFNVAKICRRFLDNRHKKQSPDLLKVRDIVNAY